MILESVLYIFNAVQPTAKKSLLLLLLARAVQVLLINIIVCFLPILVVLFSPKNTQLLRNYNFI